MAQLSADIFSPFLISQLYKILAVGENSNIAWCDHTFNGWIGCQKVSAGCDNCYAETLMDKRYHKVEWGPHGERKRTSEANWKLPYRWATVARLAGTRPKVFCSSLADVFDNQVPVQWRTDLFDLIAATPELDWLLLTKRPENFVRMLPTGIWENIWLGTTCEDQAAYDRRWPLLRATRAKVKFISYEPALSDLWLPGDDIQPDWLICGGESGAGYREMRHEWAAHAAVQCSALGIAFFMKQMAGKKQIPHDLMIREFPVSNGDSA